MMIPTIKKNKVAIFSDLHLGVHSNSSEWHKYAIEWANWFREECRDKGIKDLIFCGDWHHNRSEISVNTLQVSADILDMVGMCCVAAVATYVLMCSRIEGISSSVSKTWF